jgi:glycosyltransferase involved in cell wall biosynthesis
MKETVNLGIVTTHPIQYQVPLFREIESRSGISPTIFYDRIPDPEQQGRGFSTSFEWDIPLLNGYSWKVRNAENSSTPSFSGFQEAYKDVDVMLIHGWQSQYMRIAWWVGLRTNVPLLVRGESSAIKHRSWLKKIGHKLYLHPYDGYLFIGESNRRFYRDSGVHPDRLYPARYCVENERFDRDWQTYRGRRAELREDLRIDQDATAFLFCGKFISEKRPNDVVEGFLGALESTGASLHLVMVGDGPLRSQVEERVPESAPVTFTGFLNQTEIGKAYTAADALVLPSESETWGLVVNEGMIFQLPAIVSDRVGCGPDLVEEAETGYVFPMGDVGTLTDIVVHMGNHPKETEEMGRRARKRVRDRYTVEGAVDGIESATMDVIRSSL